MFISGVGENDGFIPVVPQSHNIFWRVFDVEVCTNGCLFLHEAKVPRWNVVLIEPFYGLTYSNSMEVLDKQPVRDDSETYVSIR